MSETPDEPSQTSSARWRLALAALVSFLAYRVWFVLSLPGIAGSDPYTRLYARDQVVVELFGRKWPPLLQLCVKTIYELGGDIGHVRIFMSLLGAGFLLCALAYARRGLGRLEALLVIGWLAVEPDILWITLAPYQELLLYTPVCLALLLLARIDGALDSAEAGATRRQLWLCLVALAPCLVLAEMARYEGVLFILAVAAALASALWQRRGGRRALPALLAIAALAVIPIVDYLAFTGGGGVTQASPTRALSPGDSLTNLDHLAHYLFRQSALLLPALAGLWVTVRRGLVGRLDLRALHLYTLLFVATYVLTTPYIPASNRRFHVPLLLWLSIHAAIGVVAVARRLLTDMSERSCRYGAAALALLLALQAGYTWRRAERFAERRTREHAREVTIGRAIEASVTREQLVLLAWPRGDYHGYPSMRNMRIIAQLGGDVARVRFWDDYAALPDEAARAEFVDELGALLVRDKKREDEALREGVKTLRERAARSRGEPSAQRVTDDVRLYTW